jgi:hypothetical protein
MFGEMPVVDAEREGHREVVRLLKDATARRNERDR